MNRASYTDSDTSSYPESDGSCTPNPNNRRQEVHILSSELEQSSNFTEWAVGAGIVLLHDLNLELELVRKAFSVQLPEWLLLKVRNSEVAERTHRAVLGTLAHSASDDGELILAGDIDEALWTVISNSVNSSLPLIRSSDAPLLEDLLYNVESIDLVLMPDEMSETLRKAFSLILASCHTLQDLKMSTFNNADQYAWKKPVDNLVEHAFLGGGSDEDIPLEIVHNTHLAIPYSTSDTPSPFSLPQHRMHSDTCIFTPKLNFSFSFDHSGLLLLRFNTGALRYPEVVNLHILQFIVEYDELDVSDIGEEEETVEGEKYPEHIKRLICHLGTAQYQRRCLGFSDHSIYGVGVSRGIARAYIAWWEVTSGDDQDQSRIYVHEIAKFNLVQPLETLRFFIFLLLIKEDIEATYHADLRDLKLQDVIRVEGQWSPTLKQWRKVKQYDNPPPSGDNGESEKEMSSAEGNKQESNDDSKGSDESGRCQRDEFEDYRDEAMLDQPTEGESHSEFVDRVTDVIMHMAFPDRHDVYARVAVGDSVFTSVMSRPLPISSNRSFEDDDDDEDEDEESIESPTQPSSVPIPPPHDPSTWTPRPHLSRDTTSDLMMSGMRTWFTWEKDSLDYDTENARRFIHEAICGFESESDDDMDIKGGAGVGYVDGVRSLSALD